MTVPPQIGRAVVFLAAVVVTTPRAAALIDFNDGRDKITVNAAYGIVYDSNVFVRAEGGGDTSQTLSLGANYTRHAGLIGVNASVAVVAGRFTKFTSEDFTNPRFTLSLSKGQGRLTGSADVSVQRESVSDSAANIRTTSWNYGSTLSIRYPVNDRYYFTSTTDFSLRDYLDNRALFNLTSYAEAIDAYYVYTSKLDFLGGYRIRRGLAEGGSHTLDQSLTTGATGSLLPKLNGSLRLGYQWRDESGPDGGRYHALTTSLSLAWPVNKRVTFSGAASKDFATTATDISVDTTAFSLSATLKPVLKVKLVLDTSAEYATSSFLGVKGAGRKDEAWTLTASASVPLSSKISTSLAYVYTDNRSNFAFSEFTRSTVTFNLSVRY